MREVSRRDAAKLMAGLTVGAGVAVTKEALADGITKPAQPQVDTLLESAIRSPSAYMFAEQVTSKLDGPGEGYDLIITSATADGRGTLIHVPSRSMRVFRADAGVDEFTKQGGLYWRLGTTKGKAQFKEPGALVMVVRDGEGTVHWYSLKLDMRC